MNRHMPRGTSSTISVSLDPTAASLAAARRAVGSILDGRASSELNSAVTLVTNEFVSNAILHGARDSQIKLVVTLSADDVEVSVHNTRSARKAPAERDHDAGGRGLRIVAGLSQRWGIESDQTDTIVSATISKRQQATSETEPLSPSQR